MGCCSNVMSEVKPVMLMVVVQMASAGVNLLYKLAANDGSNLRVLVAYRMMFATAFVLPFALILERKNRPKLTWMIIVQAFFCGLFGGFLAQNLYAEAVALSSPTFPAAIANLSPAITFILALSFGLETLGFRTVAGKAKVFGTLMGIGGAMVVTLYKGIEIEIWSTNVDLSQKLSHVNSAHTKSGSHALASFLSFATCLSYSLWLIIQTKMSQRYPCYYSSTALMSIMGAIQSFVCAICLKNDWNQWKLGFNIQLLTAAYSGIVTSGMVVVLIALCVKMRGPLYVSVFSPLGLVMVAIAGSTLLKEKLHLGCIIGAVLIICGLYMVVWGRAMEIKASKNLASADLQSLQIVTTTSHNSSPREEQEDSMQKDHKQSEIKSQNIDTGGGVVSTF